MTTADLKQDMRQYLHRLTDQLLDLRHQFDGDMCDLQALKEAGLVDEKEEIMEVLRQTVWRIQGISDEMVNAKASDRAPVKLPPHVNPDPDSLEPAEAAGLRLAISDAVRTDTVGHKGYWGKLKPRHPDQVVGSTQHVTGVGDEDTGFGTRSEHREKHDGDLLLARGERYKELEYVSICSYVDRAHWSNLPMWAYAYSSTALNAFTTSHAYDGTWPSDRAVDDDIVQVAKASLMQHLEDLWDWKVEWNERNPVNPCDERKAITLYSHRQGDEDRGRDPGPQYWTRVVLPVVAEWNFLFKDWRFEVRVNPGASFGRGKPLPDITSGPKSWQNWSLT